MISRLLIALIFIPNLFLIFIKGNYTLFLFTEVVALFSIYEFYNMLKKRGKNLYSIYGYIISSLIPLVIFLDILPIYKLLTISFIVLAVFQIFNLSIFQSIEKMSYTYLGIIYIPLLFSYILRYKDIKNGNILILFTFICIWMCDSFAYLFGIYFGKHKFTSISPKKSIEGLVGGFLGVFLTVNIFSDIYYYLTTYLSKLQILNIEVVYYEFIPKLTIQSLVFAILLTAISTLGDLYESKIKRELNFKDSSNILYGHGGFLDRFDSSLFVIPTVYIYFTYLA